MEYERSRLYADKGIDEGIIENIYVSESGYAGLRKDIPVIVFVSGTELNDLVFTAKNSRESTGLKEKVLSLIGNQQK
ncbi:MAG: hypothetical protein JW982_06675 [Spirochaetes bacterium]|nr:hypothetical protein [Spirochaetota bacterium]